jgi:hypothetical protein
MFGHHHGSNTMFWADAARNPTSEKSLLHSRKLNEHECRGNHGGVANGYARHDDRDGI